MEIFAISLLTSIVLFLTGGALKPSNTANLWVHVTCAWFVPEVRFKNIVKMQPAEGLVNIHLSTFQQVNHLVNVLEFSQCTVGLSSMVSNRYMTAASVRSFSLDVTSLYQELVFLRTLQAFGDEC